MRQTTKRCACKLSHRRENKRKRRRDGSFRSFPAKNIVVNTGVRILLVAYRPLARKKYSSLRRLARRTKCAYMLW